MPDLKERLESKIASVKDDITHLEAVAATPVTEDEVFVFLKQWFRDHRGFFSTGGKYPTQEEVLQIIHDKRMETIEQKKSLLAMLLKRLTHVRQTGKDIREKTKERTQVVVKPVLPIFLELKQVMTDIMTARRVERWKKYLELPYPDEDDHSMEAKSIRASRIQTPEMFRQRSAWDADVRMKKLIERIELICGSIEDASDLKIKPDDLAHLFEGVVVGTQGSAVVWTNIPECSEDLSHFRFYVWTHD